MTTAASDFASTAGETAQAAGTGVVETVRRNPVPAAMAAIGIGWLWTNRSQGRDGSSWNRADRMRFAGTGRYGGRYGEYGSAGSYDTEYESGGPSIGDRAREAGQTVGDAAESARRAAAQRLDDFGETAGATADNVGTTVSQAVSDAQRAVESNPLAFGAIALAVGTAVGLALPTTDAERRTLGQTSSRLIDQVETAVSEPLDEMAGSRA